MKHARVMLVKADEDAAPVDGDTAQVFEATPVLVFDSGGSSVLIKDVSATIKCINATELEVKAGTRYLATQDVGGHWVVALGAVGGSGKLQGTLTDLRVDSYGPYAGKTIGEVLVKVAPCDRPELIDEIIDVVDWSGCVFDKPIMDLQDIWTWGSEGIAEAVGGSPGELTPCHWVADDRCCTEEELGGG